MDEKLRKLKDWIAECDHKFLVKIAQRFIRESAFALFSFQGIHPFTYTALG